MRFASCAKSTSSPPRTRRRTARLLSHYAISTPTLSFHQHNIRTRVPQLLARLEAGKNVALVTDAGTPGVSDPGVELVEHA